MVPMGLHQNIKRVSQGIDVEIGRKFCSSEDPEYKAFEEVTKQLLIFRFSGKGFSYQGLHKLYRHVTRSSQ